MSFDGLSDDGKFVAYGLRKGGEDEVSIHLIDTDTRKEMTDSLPRARYLSGAAFKTDKSGFYYSKLTDAGPRAYYHAMGTSLEKDTKIFGDEYGPDKLLSVNLSENGRYLLFIAVYGSACQKSEIYFQDIAKGGPITPVVKSIDSCFQAESRGRHAVHTNTNWKAPKWRVSFGSAQQSGARKLEGSYPGERIASGKFPIDRRENHHAVFPQRGIGVESFRSRRQSRRGNRTAGIG